MSQGNRDLVLVDDALFREHVTQDFQGRSVRRGREGPQPTDEAGFVEGANLVEQDQAVLALKSDCHAKAGWSAPGGHWRGQRGAQVVVHFGR